MPGPTSFEAVVAALPRAATVKPTAAALRSALLAVTGRPAISVPARPSDIMPAAVETALQQLGGAPATPSPPAGNQSLEAQLATTRRLIAEVEVELERLRREAAELERQLAARQPRPDAYPTPGPEPMDDAVVETPVTDRMFSAIFRRADPSRPPRQFHGYVEVTVQSPVSPYAVRDLERALASLPEVSIRLVWGAPQRGTTIGLDLHQPLPLAERLKALSFVESVRELGDRGGVGRLRVRLRET
ncbi:MAG: hypothetical protein KatS3mg060_1664 [Dehalococcoidia bacterium]|nr:MAG: hypothetical protein KatS3mg060_1664 [Dehalococcoidia bacterium]